MLLAGCACLLYSFCMSFSVSFLCHILGSSLYLFLELGDSFNDLLLLFGFGSTMLRQAVEFLFEGLYSLEQRALVTILCRLIIVGFILFLRLWFIRILSVGIFRKQTVLDYFFISFHIEVFSVFPIYRIHVIGFRSSYPYAFSFAGSCC